MIKSKFFWFLFAVSSVSVLFAKEDLSELHIYNRVMLLIKEQYVQPERLNPKKMFIGALEAISKQIPELVVKESPDAAEVFLATSSQKFSTKGLVSLWDLSFLLRDVFRFIETKFPKDIKFREIEYAAVNGTLNQLDPHSILLDPKLSKEMKLSTKGEFGGLGIVVGFREGVLSVVSPLDGTPAHRAGIKALDKIIKIDDASTINLALDEAVEKMRGKPGTAVKITLQRKGETQQRSLVLIRDIIKVDSIDSHLIDKQIGYIKIKAFHGNTSSDLKAAIDGFGSVKGLILDFRNNPGGLLNESVSVSDLFLDGGVVVVTQGADASRREEEKANGGPQKTKLPIVVLVNSGSASASEIVAGALKNRNRALVVGEQTFGKGSVQMLYDFPDDSALKLTIAQYLTPGNESIQSVGITPDIILQPAYLEDKNNLLLFPQTRMREFDLNLHLDDKTRVVTRRPSYEITYMAENIAPEEQERRSLSSKFYEDFEIRFAKRLLLKVYGATRQNLLVEAKTLVPQVEKEESQKIQSALLKLGVDWSIPSSYPKTAKLYVRVVGKPFAKAGGRLKVNLEARNIGSEPVYQVYGISKSATPLLADREFILGLLQPGQKRSFEMNLELSKDLLSRRDLMRVVFHGNNQQDIASLDVPIEIQGLPKPILAFNYQINLGKIYVKVKNIGAGIAREPIVLLKNKDESDLFIEEGRKTMKALKPGDTAEVTLSFIKNPKSKKPGLQIQLYDAVSGEFWTETLDLKATKIVSKMPPKIKWLFNTRAPIVAKDFYRIQAQITGRPTLKDVSLYVGEQKVLYQAVKPGQDKKLNLNQLVYLKPGTNYITLVARDGELYSQRETLTIFSESGDPLAKNP